MLSLQQQQQQQQQQHFAPMLAPMVNATSNNEPPVDRSTVNSQQGLADKIQAVRHLWDANENGSASLDASTVYPASFLQYH